jgi:hypothetical protein
MLQAGVRLSSYNPPAAAINLAHTDGPTSLQVLGAILCSTQLGSQVTFASHPQEKRSHHSVIQQLAILATSNDQIRYSDCLQ